MVRVRSVIASKRKKKRYLKAAKGQFGHRKTRYIQARRAVVKGLAYSYRDRKVKKQTFRRLWIIRISAACREEGIPYSRFIKGLTEAKVEIDRKMIADLAVNSPAAFKKLIAVAKNGSAEKVKK